MCLKNIKIASVVPPNSIAAIQQFRRDDKEQDETDAPCQEQPGDVLEDFAKTYQFDMNPELTSEQRLAVLNVIININQFLHFTMLSSNFMPLDTIRTQIATSLLRMFMIYLQTYWI